MTHIDHHLVIMNEKLVLLHHNYVKIGGISVFKTYQSGKSNFLYYK